MSNKKVAVVTGASSGIGKVTHELLLKKEIISIAISRSLKNSDNTRTCDIRDNQEVKKIFTSIKDQYGKVDILVNSAGIVRVTDSLNVSDKEWNDVLGTNVIGTYNCCRVVLPMMQKNNSGKIVNISSIAGRTCSQTASIAYTASKHAVVGITKQLAVLFGQFNININCVAPSQTKTEMLIKNLTKEKQNEISSKIPIKRLAEPQEVAEVIAFLISDEASYVNGAVFDVNGGQC